MSDEEEDNRVWRCSKHELTCDGGVYHDITYAQTYKEMLILKDQGYRCTLLKED